MNENYSTCRAKAINYLKTKCQDFFLGISILEEAGLKPLFVKKIKEAGVNADTRSALMTNLYQLIRQWAKPESVEFDDELPGTEPIGSEIPAIGIEKMQRIFRENTTPMGAVIRKFADMYNTRAILHRQLAEVGETNDEQSIAKRKQIVVSIEALSNQMDDIYPHIRAYEKHGTVPEPTVLSNILSNHADEKGQAEKKEPAPSPSAAWVKMSREELMNYKKNLCTRIQRCNNKIVFRKENIGGAKPNPLPEGSLRRIKLEAKMKRLGEELKELEVFIAKLG